MKRNFILLCLLLMLGSYLITPVYAVPAQPTPIVVTQPDGSTLQIRLIGDEHAHYTTTLDHYLIMKHTDGFFYYAETDQQSNLKRSFVRAQNQDKRSAADRLFLSKLNKNELLQKQKRQHEVTSSVFMKNLRKTAPQRASFPTTGEIKGMVILVEYQDVKFTVNDPKTKFNELLNKEGFNVSGAVGSARDFFIESSNGAFNPHFDVYGPVTLPQEMSYYGANDPRTGQDVRPYQMAIDACNILDKEVDFTQYDFDQDGNIDNVYIFYAGMAESRGYDANCIWPHSWDIYSGAAKEYLYDGVRLDHYACSNEMIDNNHMEGIGTFCHEFTHVLGFPDLYATTYSDSFTPGPWSIMDQGSYNNDGHTPPLYSVYERYFMGWLNPKEIGEPDDIVLNDITNNEGCIIKTHLENEYFLLENKQQNRWNEFLPGHGMLIWHIDYNDRVWAWNTVNNDAKHQYVDIEEADDIQREFTRETDVFPGTENITEFTDDTQPSMRTWDTTPLNKPITNIIEKEGVIYFEMNGGKPKPIPAFNALEATDITPISFTANWEAAENAKEYIVSLSYTKADGTKAPVEEYTEKNVGNTTTFTFSDLQAETTYVYQIYAKNKFSKSEWSNEISVTTEPMTFNYMRPVAHVAKNVSEYSFMANWEDIGAADYYLLNVYTKNIIGYSRMLVDFSNGPKNLPNGWISDSDKIFGTLDFSGKKIPSLSLGQDRQQITSPLLKEDIHSLAFWTREEEPIETDSLLIEGFYGNEWKEIATVMVPFFEGKTYRFGKADFNDGCRRLRITFISEGNSKVAIDDINVTYSGKVKFTYQNAYQNTNIGKVNTFIVDNLKSHTDYYYTVTAQKGNQLSLPSKEIHVFTNESTGIDQCNKILETIQISILDNEILVTLSDMNLLNSPIRIFDLQGQLLQQTTFSGVSTHLSIPQKGIYLLQTEKGTLKIML